MSKLRHKEYLNDFARQENGQYVYAGAFYAWGSDRKKSLLRLWTIAFGMAVCAVTGGCIPAAGMDNTFYVIIPFALEILAVASVWWALVRLSFAGDPMRGYLYEGTVEKLPVRVWLTLICAALGLIAVTVFLCLHGFVGKAFWTVIFYFLKAGNVLLAFFLQKAVKSLSFIRDNYTKKEKKQENDE